MEKLKEAMFGGGCFWGIQYEFDQIKGVVETEVGFAGGSAASQQVVPTYKEVCTGKTGHAEVVHILYDPSVVSYNDLLKAFWEMHDPTTVNRQGPDVGSQYRSVIFYYDEEQKKLAEESRNNLGKSGKYANLIVTQLVSAAEFFKAEDYHQKYFEKTGQKVCH